MEIRLYLGTLQRGWYIILLAILAALNTALAVSYLTTPIYRATSRFVVSPNAGIYQNTWDVVSSLDTLDRRSIINTYKELVSSPTVYGTATIFSKIPPETLKKDYIITTTVVPDTNLVQLSVDGPDPSTILQMANAIGETSIKYINELYPVYNISIVDQAIVAPTLVRPKTAQNAGLAVVIGAMFGAVLAFLREELQNTLDRLRMRSQVDQVSSAFTRAYFERLLVQRITEEPNRELTLGLIGFRGLEEVKGVLPRPMVDRVISHMTEKVKAELRTRDIVGRWGDTTLSVLLPATPSSAAKIIFQRIQGILDETIQLGGSREMTIHPDPCIGISASKPEETSTQLTHRTDVALLKAMSLEGDNIVLQ